jgi:rod shape-determining protein MreC
MLKLSIKKGRNWRNILLFAVLVVAVIVALNFFQKQVRNSFYLISSPIQASLWQAGDRVSDFFETIVEIKNLKKENKELKLKIQSLLAENTSLKELKSENETLRTALNIGLQEEFRLTMVQVIGKDISQGLLTINRGSKQGIAKDLAVITEQKNLIGKISEVYDDFSKIMLISDKISSFDAKIQEQEIFGVVKGKGGLNLFIDRVPQEKEIKTGDILVTSALGGIFPESLLVGEIKDVKKSDIEPFQQAEISVFFNFSELENLFVISPYSER